MGGAMHESIPSPTNAERSAANLHGRLDEIGVHLRSVSEELAAERKARLDEDKHGISITALRVPFVLMILLVAPLIGAGVAAEMFVKNTRTHIANTHIHAGENEALARGGIAFERDIDEKVAASESERAKNDRAALRMMLKERPLTCTAPKGKAKTQDCKFGDQPSWNR